MTERKGVLYGVSVGPGDPELLTLKAKRILEACPVVAAPRTRGGKTLALEIARQAADLSGKVILPLSFRMTGELDFLRDSHDRNASLILDHLREGRDVALVNLGDVSIYSTFGYLRELVEAGGFETCAVPGVTSFCAAAAALGVSLTEMETPLHILPSDYGDFDASLALPGTKVILKAGGALPEIRRRLREKGLSEKTSLAADLGLPTQRLYPNAEDAEETEGYLSLLLVRE